MTTRNGDRLFLAGSVRPQLLEEMQRYSRQVNEMQRNATEDDEVCFGDHLELTAEASSAVLAAVQQELMRLAPGPLDDEVAFELFWAEFWALHEINDRAGQGAAKRAQVQVAAGRPLAICRSTYSTRQVQTPTASVAVHGKGCLRIYESPTRTSGRMFPHLCPECRPRNGKRQPLRDAERGLLARLAANST
jgi:hypothetical protein